MNSKISTEKYRFLKKNIFFCAIRLNRRKNDEKLPRNGANFVINPGARKNNGEKIAEKFPPGRSPRPASQNLLTPFPFAAAPAPMCPDMCFTKPYARKNFRREIFTLCGPKFFSGTPFTAENFLAAHRLRRGKFYPQTICGAGQIFPRIMWARFQSRKIHVRIFSTAP